MADVDVLKNIRNVSCPVMMIASNIDAIIPFQHTRDIYDSIKG
jgi:dipeptidyl aminopeptidase/acylaminoacyl peptidase